jgi:hypothetical protein
MKMEYIRVRTGWGAVMYFARFSLEVLLVLVFMAVCATFLFYWVVSVIVKGRGKFIVWGLTAGFFVLYGVFNSLLFVMQFGREDTFLVVSNYILYMLHIFGFYVALFVGVNKIWGLARGRIRA